MVLNRQIAGQCAVLQKAGEKIFLEGQAHDCPITSCFKEEVRLWMVSSLVTAPIQAPSKSETSFAMYSD